MIYVDTNILVDALRGYQPATAFLAQAADSDTVACSQVSEVELLLGAPSRSLRRPVEKLLRDLTVITPTQSDFAEAVATYRKYSLSHGVEFFDCLIGSTALRYKVPVHTRNIKHLSALPILKVILAYR